MGPFPRGGRSSTVPSLVDPFLSRLERSRLSFLFSSNPPFVRIRTRDLSLLPTRDVNRPPFSRVPKDTPSVLFLVRKGDLDRSIGRRVPFRHVHVLRRIVFVFVTTSDVHDTCEASTCTCTTTRGARDEERPQKHVVSWNKATVPPAWTDQPTGLVSQHTRKETKDKNQRAAVLSTPSTARKKHTQKVLQRKKTGRHEQVDRKGSSS